MLSGYNKVTESWRGKYVDNESTEKSLSPHPELETKVTDNQTVVILTKYRLDAYTTMSVGNISPLKLSGGPTNQVITGKIKGSWDPDRSLALVTDMGVPVLEDLSYIGTNARIEVIHLECDYE